MQLYNTKVIPSAIDGSWQPLFMPHMAGAKLLVISGGFPAGGAEEQTLQKMMAACRLATGEWSVLQIHPGDTCAWQALSGLGIPQKILLLGIKPADLSIHALFRLHAPNSFGGHQIVPALSLGELEQNPAAKKELWSDGLKPLLGL